MTASGRLRELWEPARAYIERKELGNENIVAANTFVDTLVDSAPLLISCLEAAECLDAEINATGSRSMVPWTAFGQNGTALTALREHLEGQ